MTTYTLFEIRHGDFPKDARFTMVNDPNRARHIAELERAIEALRQHLAKEEFPE